MRLPPRVPLSVGEPASTLKDAVMPRRCESVNVDPTLLRLRVARRVLALGPCDFSVGVNTSDHIAIEFPVVVPLIHRPRHIFYPPNHGNAFNVALKLANLRAQIIRDVPAAAEVQLDGTRRGDSQASTDIAHHRLIG